jgi:hypothetical protein
MSLLRMSICITTRPSYNAKARHFTTDATAIYRPINIGTLIMTDHRTLPSSNPYGFINQLDDSQKLIVINLKNEVPFTV